MKIFFKGDVNYIKDEIGKVLKNVKFLNYKTRYFEITGFRKGYIYDKLPQLKNINGITKIELKNEELFPLLYEKSYYFKKPVNTFKKFIIAGPCVIHNFNEFREEVLAFNTLEVDAIRAPLFKPRSSPYGWEGYGRDGIERLMDIKKLTKKPFVGEVLDTGDIPIIIKVFDIIQIGARNMKNYALLKEVANTGKPILIKRQPFATLKEVMYSLEYLLKYHSKKIILCERGNNISDDTPSISIDIIKKAKKEFKIPVIADLSHSAKRRDYVFRFARLTKKLADGFMIESSINPHNSPIDTPQIISLEQLKKLIKVLK